MISASVRRFDTSTDAQKIICSFLVQFQKRGHTHVSRRFSSPKNPYRGARTISGIPNRFLEYTNLYSSSTTHNQYSLVLLEKHSHPSHCVYFSTPKRHNDFCRAFSNPRQRQTSMLCINPDLEKSSAFFRKVKSKRGGEQSVDFIDGRVARR